jgi:hypothetical protein
LQESQVGYCTRNLLMCVFCAAYNDTQLYLAKEVFLWTFCVAYRDFLFWWITLILMDLRLELTQS